MRMRLAARWMLMAAAALTVGWGAAGAAPASAEGCPNETFRAGPSANLPDCRAYEQVSPVDKNGLDIIFGNGAIGPDGDSATYMSLGAFAGNQAGSFFAQYLSTRGPSGWSTEGISPPQAPSTTLNSSQYQGFSSDLTHMVVQNGDPPVDGATPGTTNLYRRDVDGSLRLVSLGEPSSQEGPPGFADASADYSHIVFDDANALTPNAPTNGVSKVYEWVNGNLSLLSVLPNGTPTDGVAGGNVPNAMSTDGTRVYWTLGSGPPNAVYLNQAGSSTEITAPQCVTNPSCPSGSGSGTYWTASADGSKAFFTSNEQLTDDSSATAVDQGDMYEYDANTGMLADLTVDRTDPNGADVLGVVGASDDGSYVYFVAGGVLASGATLGRPNLYVRHADTTVFIATLDPGDAQDWSSSGSVQQSWRAQVAKDGLHVLLTSVASLSPGYDNAGNSEVYMYEAGGTGKLTCISCNPSGAPATGQADLAGSAVFQQTATLATVNNMSADGTRAFFETTDALVPQDTNGVEDVYEWEADGTGGCLAGAGCVYLISSGRSSSPSYFEDATPSGSDMFFLTREGLVVQDADSNVDVYDARVGGGFLAAALPAPCPPEDCHGQPQTAPAVVAPASVSFAGHGNLTPPAVKAKPRLSRAQKLARALRACRKKPKRQRKRCQLEARRRFGARKVSAIRGAK